MLFHEIIYFIVLLAPIFFKLKLNGDYLVMLDQPFKFDNLSLLNFKTTCTVEDCRLNDF